MGYKISRDDILKKIYFIINLAQQHKSETMQETLTSKSDLIGGIFDRFVNTISEDLIFNKIILPEIKTNKKICFIGDYYYYSPTKNGAGIAPDIFGIKVDDKTIPFTVFNEKWEPVDGMPQIEVKTFKAKDQMVSLRDQEYAGMTLVLADLKLRIDYLVPFLDKNLLNDEVFKETIMDNDTFVNSNEKGRVKSNLKVDLESNDIGEVSLIAITNASSFTSQATKCGAGISVRRMKYIRMRNKLNCNSIAKLAKYASVSPRIGTLYEFKKSFYKFSDVNYKDTIYVDFSCSGINKINIYKKNNDGIVIMTDKDGCSFNGEPLVKNKFYTVAFDTLGRKESKKEEYFMQKQCASHLQNEKDGLLLKLESIINS